jgi:hypothetical protein
MFESGTRNEYMSLGFIFIIPHRSREVKCGCRAAAVFCILRRYSVFSNPSGRVFLCVSGPLWLYYRLSYVLQKLPISHFGAKTASQAPKRDTGPLQSSSINRLFREESGQVSQNRGLIRANVKTAKSQRPRANSVAAAAVLYTDAAPA